MNKTNTFSTTYSQGDPAWFVYWLRNPGIFKKYDQILFIRYAFSWLTLNFDYYDLRMSLTRMLSTVERRCKCLPEEIDQLRKYIERFFADVENEFTLIEEKI